MLGLGALSDQARWVITFVASAALVILVGTTATLGPQTMVPRLRTTDRSHVEVAGLPDGWVALPRHPTGILEGSALVHEGEVWSIGGHPCVGKRSFKETNVFALREGGDAWQRRPRLPQLHHIFHAAFSSPGRISVISGLEAMEDGSHRKNTRVFELDTSPAARSLGDRWAWQVYETNETIGGMASCAPRLQPGAEPVYCVEGTTGNFMPRSSQHTTHLFAFYPLSRRLKSLAGVPEAAQSNHVALMRIPGDRLLLMTGRNDKADEPMNEGLFAYSIALDTWSMIGPTPPMARGFDTRSVWQHPTEPWALLLGGQNADFFAITSAILRIDFGADTDLKWTAWSALPQALSGVSAVTLESNAITQSLRILVLGGAVGVGVHCVSDVYQWDGRPDPSAALAVTAVRTDLSPNSRPLVVIAAFYGPYVVTKAVQALLDSGVRGLHMGRSALDPRELGGTGALPSRMLTFHDLGVPAQGMGAFSLVVLCRDPSGALRTVACPHDGACLF